MVALLPWAPGPVATAEGIVKTPTPTMVLIVTTSTSWHRCAQARATPGRPAFPSRRESYGALNAGRGRRPAAFREPCEACQFREAIQEIARQRKPPFRRIAGMLGGLFAARMSTKARRI